MQHSTRIRSNTVLLTYWPTSIYCHLPAMETSGLTGPDLHRHARLERRDLLQHGLSV
ncbi:MAG: hypothetical protein GY820_14530 [Gammaproteobacteria bacterium]|nr:hypothetical protein [Gammaproteobacteria bacterium]